MDQAEDFAARWSLRDLRSFAETPTSHLWRASAPQGGVVLKLLKPRGAEERIGFVLMSACDGLGMVRILRMEGDACLMEHLPGPSLGDLVRQGNDAVAAEILADVAAAIGSVPPPPGLTRLEAHLRALHSTDLTQFPADSRALLAQARTLAGRLFASAPAPVSLHGDLHHDNVLSGPGGWRAIDAKGLVGDPAFELANSFRNPWDRQDLATDPARARLLADIFARRLGLPRDRLLAWAFVHVAVSVCWFAEDAAKADEDLALLPVLSSVLGDV